MEIQKKQGRGRAGEGKRSCFCHPMLLFKSLLSVQAQIVDILDEFPTNAAQAKDNKEVPQA
jgi:hypothetical protein